MFFFGIFCDKLIDSNRLWISLLESLYIRKHFFSNEKLLSEKKILIDCLIKGLACVCVAHVQFEASKRTHSQSLLSSPPQLV